LIQVVSLREGTEERDRPAISGIQTKESPTIVDLGLHIDRMTVAIERNPHSLGGGGVPEATEADRFARVVDGGPKLRQKLKPGRASERVWPCREWCGSDDNYFIPQISGAD
jgi:hypothetical protein